MFSRPGCMLRQGSHGLDRGIYEPVPGLLDTLFEPKVASDQGAVLSRNPGHLILLGSVPASPSWAHSRFASGCGPNRQVALFALLEHILIMYDLSDV